MTRKFLLVTLTAALGFVLSGGVTLAQRDRQPASVDQQVKRLAGRLNLNTDQQGKIRPILEDQRHQMEALRSDSSLSREDRVSKMRSIWESATSKIKDNLNDDQKKQFHEMRQESAQPQGPEPGTKEQ